MKRAIISCSQDACEVCSDSPKCQVKALRSENRRLKDVLIKINNCDFLVDIKRIVKEAMEE